MASKSNDTTNLRSDEQGADTTPKPRAYPDDDGPKSAGYLNQGDGPSPETDPPEAPRS